MTDVSKLPILKPVEPIAKCGWCGNEIFPDGQCQASAGPQPKSCPLYGDEWRNIKRMLDMRNSYVG
jgi:hypothetical protein